MGQILPFPIGFCRRLYNTLAVSCESVIVTFCAIALCLQQLTKQSDQSETYFRAAEAKSVVWEEVTSVEQRSSQTEPKTRRRTG